MLRPDDPKHSETRKALRTLGIVLFLVGLVFTVIGVGNFFMAFGTFEPPRYFWCAFIGLPLLAVGKMLMAYGYFGAFTRYVANEAAPVGKDTFNYLAEETRDGVRNLGGALGEGLRGEPDQALVACPKCGTGNDAESNFCKQCGAPIPHAKTCTKCGQRNDPDARFCRHCGADVTGISA